MMNDSNSQTEVSKEYVKTIAIQEIIAERKLPKLLLGLAQLDYKKLGMELYLRLIDNKYLNEEQLAKIEKTYRLYQDNINVAKDIDSIQDLYIKFYRFSISIESTVKPLANELLRKLKEKHDSMVAFDEKQDDKLLEELKEKYKSIKQREEDIK